MGRLILAAIAGTKPVPPFEVRRVYPSRLRSRRSVFRAKLRWCLNGLL